MPYLGDQADPPSVDKRETKSSSARGGRESAFRVVANFACFFGSMLLGALAVVVTIVASSPRVPRSAAIVPVGCLAGLILLVALVRLGRAGRAATLAPLGTGLFIGVGLYFIFGPFLIFVDLFAGLFGCALGLIAIIPCWRAGDRPGRLMALVGIVPVVLSVALDLSTRS